jgi:serine/threonine protein kinase
MIEGFEEFEKRENMNDNVYYLILEYCSKGDLAKFLQRNRRKPLPYNRFLRFSIQILKGIVSMHEIGIGHFDLKPANIFLCEDYSVKLGDFGFSGSFGKEVTGGSLEYIAPEQLTTKTANLGNAKYDIFAFGTICLELLTRKKRDLKLEMKTEDWLDVIWNNECMNDYPEVLLPILKSLLHPSGNKRPTAKDVLNQFEILEKDPDQHL